MTPPTRAPYVARDASDLVAMVPLVLGFHPSASVVVLTFGASGFHARCDLPTEEGARAEVADLLARACLANAAERCAVLLYTEDHDLALAQGCATAAALLEVRVGIVDVVQVDARRWYLPLEGDVTGTPYDVRCHPFLARGVFEGRAVLPDRGELERSLHGGDPAERRELARLARAHRRADPDAEAAWLRQRVATCPGTEPLDTEEAARVLAAVVRGEVRDAAWVDLRRETAGRHLPLWTDLVRRSPQGLVPGPAAVLALAAYLSGDGALAWCALDRCLAVDPDHTLGRLVADALNAAVPPSAWPGPLLEAPDSH